MKKTLPSPKRKASPARVDVAAIRREQIVSAAADIISRQGIQNLSLSAIEGATGMSRGQLTYYFAAKEDILLAVFDRMVRRMQERMADDRELKGDDAWTLIQALFGMVLTRPIPEDFTQLQYTFLAQTGHRDDFRARLASLYEGWRADMGGKVAKLPTRTPSGGRLVASLVQALVHGLIIQMQADPRAFNRAAMLDLCLEVVGGYLGRIPTGVPPLPHWDHHSQSIASGEEE